MSTTSLVVQERILDRRSSAAGHRESPMVNLLREFAQVLAGGIVSVRGRACDLTEPLRRDLGLD